MDKCYTRYPQKARRQGAARKAWLFHADEPQRRLRAFWGITLRGGEDSGAWRCCRLLVWNTTRHRPRLALCLNPPRRVSHLFINRPLEPGA